MAAIVLIAGLMAGALGLYAGVVVALNWFRVYRLAPAGEGFGVALTLGTFNYPAVAARLGPEAATPILGFRKGIRLFVICVGAFMVLTIINIASGAAA